MPYRVFPSGQYPTAEVIQKYLMDQAVIVCTSTTRPGVPVVGMVIFEQDTGQFRVWLGGIWDRFASTTDWDESGNLTVNGTLTTTGQATVGAGLTVTGDNITVGGQGVNRLVDGKVTASSSDTGDVTARTSIPGANAQNVSVIQDRAYRCSGFISCLGSVVGDRFALEAWNGTVGVNGLGGAINHRILATNFQSFPFGFIWRASATESMSNLNLSIQRISGTGTVRAQTDGNYFMVVEHLGPASAIGGL